MKFKYMVTAFGVTFIVIILLTVLLPFMVPGTEYAVNFKYITLPILLFMALLLICMSTFFFFNYRLFSLLEREDWPALAFYLEQKIFVKGRYSTRNVRLLASSYLVISDFQSVVKLENRALTAKPSVIGKNVLIFGAARVLIGSHTEAMSFFKTYLEKCKKKDKQWVRWFYGFSKLLSGAFRQAEPDFSTLAISSDNILITGLSAFFLRNSVEKYSLNTQKCHDTAERGRQRVVKVLNNIESWKREADRVGSEIHIAIIKKYIDEAGKWLFSKD